MIASSYDLYYVIFVEEPLDGGNGNTFSSSVMRVPLAGGEPTQVASGSVFGQPILTATSVLVLGGSILPSGGDAIVSIPLSGSPSTPIVALATNSVLVNGLATDGTFAYFGDQNGLQAARLGSDSALVTIVPGGNADGMAVFGQRLIFATDPAEVDSVALPPQVNAPVTTLGTTGPGPIGLTSCGSKACWLDETTNTLEEIEPLGGAIDRIALTGPLATPYTFVFDGRDFYVIGEDASDTVQSLARVPGSGGGLAIVATMPPTDPTAVAVDDECVYWSNARGIFSVAKSAQGPFNP
jgi:hypothetical protein